MLDQTMTLELFAVLVANGKSETLRFKKTTGTSREAVRWHRLNQCTSRCPPYPDVF